MGDITFTTDSKPQFGPTDRRLAAQLLCHYGAANVNVVTGLRTSFTISKATCDRVGPPPFTSQGNPITCPSNDNGVSYTITESDVPALTYPGCQVIPVLAAPTGVSANPYDTMVELTWTPVPGVARYGIRYKPATASTWTTTNTKDDHLRIDGLTNGLEYDFQVRSLGDGTTAVDSLWTSTVKATPVAPVPVVITDTGDVMAGEKIDLAGSGWPFYETVRVGLFNGSTEVIGVDAYTGSTGTFARLFVQVPAETPTGNYTLRAWVEALMSNEVPIVVEERHSLILPSRTDLNSAVVADADRTIKVTGAVFPAGETGTVSLMTGAPGSGGDVVTSSPATIDAEGSLPEVALIVPRAQERGDYHLVAAFGSETSDDTPIAIRYPQAIWSPTTIRGGTSLQLSGKDFHPWPMIDLKLADPNGTWYTGIISYTSPDGTVHNRRLTTKKVPGVHSIIYWAEGTSIITQPILVLPDMQVTPDNATVQAGASLTVTGTGFAVSSTGTIGLYDGETVIVEANVTTTDAGEFPATALLVPAGQTPGAAQLRASINGEVSPEVAITVEAAG